MASRSSIARAPAPTPRGAASRARLVRAAREELIERDGVLEVDSVAARADASVGLIYRHFGSRAGLIGAVVDDFYDRLRAEALETNPVPGGTFAERERARAALFVAFHHADPLARIIAHNLHLDAEVARIEARHRDEMIELARSVMALGQRRGEVPADRDAGFIAAMVIGGMREVLGVALSAAQTPDQDETAERLWVLIAGVMGVAPLNDRGWDQGDPDRMRDRLAAWARADGRTVTAVSRLPGHSGLSYGFSLDGDELVIRVPPLGVRRSGTTDVLRQVPLLRLLDAHGVPVPRVRFSGDDERWFGTPYLVVDRVPGAMPGDVFAGRPPADRDALFDQAVDALVRIHRIDPSPLPDGWAAPVELPDLLDHWLRLLERCEDAALIAAGRELHGLLHASVPEATPPGIVHGDFYQNNWMASGSALTAVLDWESAHLGPASIDVGYLMMMYDAASWDPALRTDLVDDDRPGRLLARYERSSGRRVVRPGWFRALAGLRLGTLTAYFLRLHRTGRRPDETWEAIGPSAPLMFRRAVELARAPG